MTQTVKIDEGSTYEYLAPGFIIIVIALITLMLHWLIALLLIIIGIGIIAIATGIEIDVESRKIRKIKRFMGFSFGEWLDLTQFVSAELKFNTQHANLKERPVALTSPMLMTRVVKTTKTYDLILTNDLEEKRVFNAFLKIGLALKTIKALEKIPDLEVINHVDNWVERSVKIRDKRSRF